MDPTTPTVRATVRDAKPGERFVPLNTQGRGHITAQANRYGRLRNKWLAEARRELDLLRRDITRGHHTTRVKRALRRAARATTPTFTKA